jgi:proteasome lid subunit RPN8/RPN11
MKQKTKKPQFRNHKTAHFAVLNNEHWFSDNLPNLGAAFSTKKANKRHKIVVKIVQRAAKRAAKNGQQPLAEALGQLLKKLKSCGPRDRCGSLACPRCARAFQKAKVVALEAIITSVSKERGGDELVFVTIIPKRFTYTPDEFDKVDVRKANRWFKDVIKAVGKRTIIGSADLGWEKRRGKQYLQLHWHLVMWTKSPRKLGTKLKGVFGKKEKYQRSVDVCEAKNLGFLAYMNKGIKLPTLLRKNRRKLAELMLVLERTEAMDLLVLGKLRLSAQVGALAFRPIGRVGAVDRGENRIEKNAKMRKGECGSIEQMREWSAKSTK